MSSSVTRLEQVIAALEDQEEALRSAAAQPQASPQTGEASLEEELDSIADSLKRDREDLAALCKRLRRFAEDPDRAAGLTGHGDQNDPDSDLGL